MVYSLPVLIFCFINVFNSTWADACNSLPSVHRGNDETFNNRNIFRSIFFEHALRREPRMVNVCERVGTERLVNNRRIVDSDSRISDYPARDGTNSRIQDSRIVRERHNPNIREQRRENIRECKDMTNRRSAGADREILINSQSRSSDPTTDFQRRNVRERVVREERNRVTRNEVRYRNFEDARRIKLDNSRTLDASRERDLDIRLDQTVRNSRVDRSSERSRSVRSLPDVSRNNDLEDSIRVIRDSDNNAKISRDLIRHDRSVRVSSERVGRNANYVRSRSVEDREAVRRMVRDSRTNEIKQDRSVRVFRERVSRNANDVRSRSVEHQDVIIRMDRDSRTNERIARDLTRQDRTVRISRERESQNANEIRSRSIQNREAEIRMPRNSRTNEKISKDLTRQDRTVRISRERENRNLNRVRSRNLQDPEAEIRMDRDSRTNERISRDLTRQDRTIRISREREGRNVNDFRSINVEDVRIRNTERVQDDQASIRVHVSRNNKRISRDLTRQDRTDRVARERVERSSNDLQSRSVENVQIRDDRAAMRVRDSRTNERMVRQDRTVRVSRDKNANFVRSRSVEDVRIRNIARVRSDPEVLISMGRDSRNNARVFRNVRDFRERVVRITNHIRSGSLKTIRVDSEASNRVIRDSRGARLSRNLIRLSRNVRSQSVEDLRNTVRVRDDARRISNLESSRRIIRESRENVRDRTARISRERDTRTASRSLEDLHRNVRSIRNQILQVSNRRVREDELRNSQSRIEPNERFSRENSRNFQSLHRDSRIRSARNIRDELQFVIITKTSPRKAREQIIREITSRIDLDSRRNVQKQQVGSTLERRFTNSLHISQRRSEPQENLKTRHPELAMRSINARFSIKDENNNDVDDSSSRSLLLNGKLSTWSNALTTILGILFVAHVLSTSSNTKKSPMKYFSSLFSYQKEKVL